MFNDGGPAFPQLNVEVVSDHMAVQNVSGGMSLWDFYAAAAMTGMLVSSSFDDSYPDSKTAALEAADYADAMIAEREKRRANLAKS